MTQPTLISISVIHAILSFSSNNNFIKFTFHLTNDQYGSYMQPRPVKLSQELSEISSEPFSGIIQIGLLPDSDSKNKDVLDRFSSCFCQVMRCSENYIVFSISLGRKVQVI